MKKRGVAIYWQIFWGLVLGLIVGVVAVQTANIHFVKMWIAPLGDIFIRILGLISLPLVFISITKAIINLESTAKLVTLGWRTVMTYTLTTVVATLFAIALVAVVRPGDGIPVETSQNYFGSFSSEADDMIQSASDFVDRSPLSVVVDIIPHNIITPLAGGNMLQALILALFLGLAIVTFKGGRLDSVRKLILDLDDLLSHAIDLSMYIAPVGIFALMACVVVDSDGDVEVLKALGRYALTAVGGIIAFAYLFYPLLIKFFTKIKVCDYLSAILPAQLMAISTSSSAATLPTTMSVANDRLGIPKSVSSFTLPMGVTINMDGSSIYICVTVIFMAQLLNIDLTFAQIMAVMLTSIIASVGTPGVPGGVLVTVVMVFDVIGIPLESIALVIAIIRPIDMFVTALNVTGDIAVSAVIAAQEGEEIEEA